MVRKISISKFFVVLSIDHVNTYFNAYTLILRKKIFEREKKNKKRIKVIVIQNYDLIANTVLGSS